MSLDRRDGEGGEPDREHHGERGVSAVEFAVISLPLFTLIFLVIQAGLYYHAVNVAQAVAQTAARVVRTYPGAPGQVYANVPDEGVLQGPARRAALQTWRDLDANHTLAKEPTVEVHVDKGQFNQVTVTVRSESVNLLPAILPSLPVVAKASGPIEIFKRPGEN